MSITPHWAGWPTRDVALDPDGYIYVLEFSNDVVKVGKTISPRTRAGEHERDVSRFGETIVRWWLSKVHRGYHENEVALITAGARMGRTLGSVEFFADCSFAALVEVARGLPAAPSTITERAAVEVKPRIALRRRRVVELRGEGLSFEVIAKKLGVSVGCVHKDWASHAHVTIRSYRPRVNGVG